MLPRAKVWLQPNKIWVWNPGETCAKHCITRTVLRTWYYRSLRARTQQRQQVVCSQLSLVVAYIGRLDEMDTISPIAFSQIERLDGKERIYVDKHNECCRARCQDWATQNRGRLRQRRNVRQASGSIATAMGCQNSAYPTWDSVVMLAALADIRRRFCFSCHRESSISASLGLCILGIRVYGRDMFLEDSINIMGMYSQVRTQSFARMWRPIWQLEVEFCRLTEDYLKSCSMPISNL